MAALSWLCLAGSIPTEWANGGGFQSLQELWLYNNSLAGSLPKTSTRHESLLLGGQLKGPWNASGQQLGKGLSWAKDFTNKHSNL